MADNAKWYVIHTYSGYENAVKAAIEKSVVNRNMSDMVLKMEIPMETVTEVTESGMQPSPVIHNNEPDTTLCLFHAVPLTSLFPFWVLLFDKGHCPPRLLRNPVLYFSDHP